MPEEKPLSVLFVCLGNICRSPMAEGVFRSLTNNLPSSSSSPHKAFGTIDSAGTGAYHALDPPDSRTLAVLAKHGVDDYEHAARKVRTSDFSDFDYIFAMDSQNLSDLNNLRRRLVRAQPDADATLAKAMLFGKFGGRSEHEDVEDPYYGGKSGFDTVYEQMVRFSKGFLAHVEQHRGGE